MVTPYAPVEENVPLTVSKADKEELPFLYKKHASHTNQKLNKTIDRERKKKIEREREVNGSYPMTWRPPSCTA